MTGMNRAKRSRLLRRDEPRRSLALPVSEARTGRASGRQGSFGIAVNVRQTR